MSGEARKTRSRAKRRSENGLKASDPVVTIQPSIATSELVLWKSPLRVLHYSTLETIIYLRDAVATLLRNKLYLAILSLLIGVVAVIHYTPGDHQTLVFSIEKYLLWCGWWVGLGILSSVGLGTGLHTFLLYLGPHIAAVTMAAYECQSTDFPEPPYPDQILCPSAGAAAGAAITIWDILSKVRVEAFCWGMGTAIGELPPYFMARACRLSGKEPGEEEQEFLELQEKLNNPESLTTLERWKLRVQWAVEKVGFMGILLCASIPNPLFDLAGMTCGHFLVPFWTFFGATLIGKAIVKMHIQKIFVILAFNETLLESSIELLKRIPVVGLKLEAPIRSVLAQQKDKLHRKSGGAADAPAGGNIFSAVFEKFVLAMVVYFVVSILNSLAQSYGKRLEAERKSANKD